MSYKLIIFLYCSDNFVFMKMDEEILELRTNSSDSHDSVDTAYESESSSSVLRTMLVSLPKSLHLSIIILDIFMMLSLDIGFCVRANETTLHPNNNL